MKTKILFEQPSRKVFLTPWKESFRGRMKEVLADVGAEAPMFDSTLPEEFDGTVVEMPLVHVAVTDLSAEESAQKASDWRAFAEAVKSSAGVRAEAVVRPIVVGCL